MLSASESCGGTDGGSAEVPSQTVESVAVRSLAVSVASTPGGWSLHSELGYIEANYSSGCLLPSLECGMPLRLSPSP